MTEKERKQKAKEFAEYWKDKGYEKGQSQKFWLSFLRDILGVDKPEQIIEFEETVKEEHTKFIDGWIDSTKVLIEQKSSSVNLRLPIKQSDGSLLTPFQQALNYNKSRPYSKRARWIITCNFQEFLIYDMEKPNGEPESILLKDLPKECYRLQFIVEQKNELLHREEQISIKAGELVGILYEALLKQYDEKDEEELKSLNEFCVRIIFCLYAEDSGLFGERLAFHNYIKSFSSKNLRGALIDLFKVLDTKIENRDKYLGEDLAKFPYVNGGLFSNENIIIPQLTEEIRSILLRDASENFDWSEISPTIFGAVFESTLNPETRRSGGMHYTSIENIHKVIDPLFLNELKKEFEDIKNIKQTNKRNESLTAFQNKLANLNFLDPACGSGNFLTETYISLRKLENEVIKLKLGDGVMTFLDDFIKVSIGQFYGIEINDFAVTVAKTALWIAESQMMKETEEIVKTTLDFLPLKSYANIIEGNALRIDWETVCPKEKLSYIMGNPPFIGMKEQTEDNKKDMKLVINIDKFKQLDYVACWYFKSAQYINNTNIQVAFVSSNSITQGEQALTMWQPLFKNEKIYINFAHRTFKWSSEAKDKAAVHCVIIGFAKFSRNKKIIYENGKLLRCSNINHYLTPSENVFVQKVGKPICNVQEMTKGAQLIDNGNFVVGGEKEYNEVIEKYPNLVKYIKKYYNARDLINDGDIKYVLYLEHCSPKEIRDNQYLIQRVNAVYEFRANNTSPSTNVLKDTPSKYFQPQVPLNESVVVPVVSSENRRYIPMCFMPRDVVYTNALFFVDNATIYTFGVLTSNVHMAWMRTLCGRLKSDYRYSNTIVYNTFPWCEPTEEQKAKIEQTAQGILDARALYPDCSLADLYDELTMPPELRRAHQLNDKAVMEAYGFSIKMTESECVAELMKMYQKLTSK